MGNDIWDDRAKELYCCYGDVVGWKSVSGADMPTWEELRSNKDVYRAWIQVAKYNWEAKVRHPESLLECLDEIVRHLDHTHKLMETVLKRTTNACGEQNPIVGNVVSMFFEKLYGTSRPLAILREYFRERSR